MKKIGISKIVSQIALVVALVGGADVAQAQLANSPWPKPFQNLSNTSTGAGFGANGKILWTASTGAGAPGSFAIGADGTVYAGSNDDNLYALDPLTGSIKWSYLTGAQVPGGVTAGADGTIYFGSFDGNVYAVNGQTGKSKWKFTTGGVVSCTPDLANGTIYVGSEDGYFYGINASNGTQKFKVKLSQIMSDYTISAIAKDGSVVFATADGYLWSVNGQTGNLNWKVATPPNPQCPAIGPDGTIYLVATDTFATFTANGVPKWSFKAAGGDRGAVTIGSTYVYALLNGLVYAFNPTSGTVAWSYNIGGDSIYCLAAGGDGTIYSGTRTGTLVALDGSTGVLRWATDLGGNLCGCPAIGSDGTLFLGVYPSGENSIVAIQSDRSLKLGISVPTVFQGASTSATITLSTPAPAGGTYVQLREGGANVSIPTSVTVPAGKTTTSFPVNTTLSAGPSSVDIIGKESNGDEANAYLNVFTLNRLTLAPKIAGRFDEIVGTVYFSCPAPANFTLDLSQSSQDLHMPSSLSVPVGATQASFTANPTGVSTAESDVITASFKGGAPLTATFIDNPVAIDTLTFAPTIVLPGSSAKGTVTLKDVAPNGETIVALSSSSSSFSAPSTVTIPAGAKSASFFVKAPTSSGPYTTTVTASALPGFPVSAPLSVIMPTSLTFSPASVLQGPITGTVTLNSPAPTNVAISLASSNSYLRVPGTVTIRAGRSSGTFTASASFGSPGSARVTASLQGVSVTSSVTLLGYLSDGDLSLTEYTGPHHAMEPPTTVVVAAVTLNQPAPSGGLTVKINLSSYGSNPFPASVLIPAGASTATFKGTFISSQLRGRTLTISAPDGTSAYATIK